MILSYRGRSRSCTDTVTELRASQSHQEAAFQIMVCSNMHVEKLVTMEQLQWALQLQ